jgi:hypothetical protein
MSNLNVTSTGVGVTAQLKQLCQHTAGIVIAVVPTVNVMLVKPELVTVQDEPATKAS